MSQPVAGQVEMDLAGVVPQFEFPGGGQIDLEDVIICPMGTSVFGTWQPISTAPTGIWILTYSQDGVIRVAMWIKGAIQEPTHWMPLQPPLVRQSMRRPRRN